MVKQVEKRTFRTGDRNFQDKIDSVLTHPVVGLPIFAAVMFLVFQISQAWLGVWIAEGYTFANGTTIPGLVTLIDGCKEWLVLRTGMDFRLRCGGCGHEVMLPRSKAEKNIRTVIRENESTETSGS